MKIQVQISWVGQSTTLELSCRWCVRCLNWQQDQRESEIGQEPVFSGIGAAKKGKGWNLAKSQTWNLSVVSVVKLFSIPEHYEYWILRYTCFHLLNFEQGEAVLSNQQFASQECTTSFFSTSAQCTFIQVFVQCRKITYVSHIHSMQPWCSHIT